MEKKSKPKDYEDLNHDFDMFEKFLDDIDPLPNTFEPERQAGKPPTINKVFIGSLGGAVVFVRPHDQQPISPEYMLASSMEVRRFLTAEVTRHEDFVHCKVIVALTGDILALETRKMSLSQLSPLKEKKGADKDDIIGVSLEPGTHVRQTAEGDYIAEQYGFVCLEENRLSIVSPLKIDNELLQVDWLIPVKHPQNVSLRMLDFWVKKEEIVMESNAQLHDLVKKVNEGILAAGCYPIATGIAPVPGDDGRIEWQVNLEQSVGLELPDGRIDFRERNFVINVKAGQAVARLKMPQKGLPGRDVKGQVLPAVDGVLVQLAAGNNIRQIQTASAETLYIATIDGALHYNGRTVSVSRVLVLTDGVNYQTGNIDFNGDVIIHGPITSGFTVQAGGDVFVAKPVDDGVKIIAQGDVTVSRSISGKRTVVKAGKTLCAQIVNEALVMAGQKILLGNYAHHAKLRTNGIIQIKKGAGKHGGSIMGGQAWASQSIDTFTAGAKAWVQTELRVGILPEPTEVLDKLQQDIEGKNAHIRQILDYFGLAGINLDKIRSMIDMAEGITQKAMALRAKYLAKLGKALQELLIEKETILSQLGPAPENAEIIIREAAYPNVFISIGNKKRKIESELGPVTFQLYKNKLTAN